MNSILSEGAKLFGIDLSEEADAAFSLYTEMLLEANKVMNLTAITEPEEIYSKHFVDSFSCQSLIPNGAAVADIGSGAGFPGLPLKIVRPDISLIMLDSLGKRVTFLKNVLDALKINGASALHVRAEDGAHTMELRESFDVVVSRAVASLPVLCEYCMPYVRKGGVFLALKGRDAEAEADSAKRAVKLFGGEISEVRKVFWRDMEHRVVIIVKTGKTPSQYPRKAGKPTKEPII